jgi:hypothetical protein
MSTFKINTFVKFAQVLNKIQWHIQLDIKFEFIEPCSESVMLYQLLAQHQLIVIARNAKFVKVCFSM